MPGGVVAYRRQGIILRRESKKMSRSWFVLRLPGHSLLLHHLAVSEDHQGSSCHRDQRHPLLFPDDIYCAFTHLPQPIHPICFFMSFPQNVIYDLHCHGRPPFCSPFIRHPLFSRRTGFLGPRDKRLYLTLRGFLGSNAMILLFYAVQQMPLADATVIIFSNPVFTSLLAWAFLKEKCTIWDCVFTVFTLTGVILIARPPFIFGENIKGIEGDYTNHVKGSIAAFAGAIGAACTMVVLRKIGKSVHYLLSVWYYAVIGFAECVIMISVLGQWELPLCGRDRWMLMLIAVLGIAGQSFLTKALQLEKAGPVALMRTVDVVLAFFFQFVFLGQTSSYWSLGGALCIVMSTSGVALRKWYTSSRKS
ncbi:solute carrier family 35 member G1 isoform X3 [Stigmatopora nigra]